ncbi:MAG: CHAT domain-containing protein [Cytophagales bacterium]|nr:MAG: CHAT domain-containing protein [Cytophagales bacterium]
MRFSLAKYAQMEKSKLDAANINLDSLENKANSLEKDLSLKSEAFASITDDKVPTWQDVQKQLKKNEAAIELVRINKFGIAKIVTDTSAQKVSGKFPEYKVHDLTDSIHYAALIVTTKSKEPELVLLKNGNDLETLYATYQKNAIAFQQEDTASYKQFWQPIGQKLKEMGIKKGGKVFLSPDGVYNQISLNTLFNPKTKKYLMDELEIHTVTNTKDILAFGKAENKNLKAELIGFPSYDLDQNTWANLSNEAAEADAFASRSFSAGFQTVSMLPGTQLEIVNIQSILGQNGYQSGISIAEKATEESVKAVQNPKILHIATHGFFIGANEKNEKIDPMLRSGLLLAGCSNYAKAEEKPQTEDGILTALEAANLELDETDLVVLSACETGLGDVKAGEGVYGLQRAFRVAGAKSILISLWKVDDAATQKLMTSFYKNLSKLDNARLAFKVAQKEIRKEYPDPYFWGAFVLVGE